MPLLGGCKTGEAKATTAGKLAARYVIHTVGPVWRGGGHGEPALLADCHTNALGLAAELGCATIAFPAISTGIYGYPIEQAAAVALSTTMASLDERGEIERVTFVLFDSVTHDYFARTLDELRA